MRTTNVTIVGGGTAGWLAALRIHHAYPYAKITLIASEEIGILGAGEGTVPLVTKFLGDLGISISDVVKNCSATLKLGILFKNWCDGTGEYLHNFAPSETLNELSSGVNAEIVEYVVTKYKHLDDINFSAKLAKKKKAPYTFIDTLSFAFNTPEQSMTCHSFPALHFDANKLAAYLKQVAIHRGIRNVDAKVVSFRTNAAKEVYAVEIEGGPDIPTDFLVDCSGFARLGLGKLHNEEWVSYSDKLPVDTAVPFFIPHNNDVAPVTEAIAMKYGWVWKIPVRDRYGCGYVFDSAHINKEEALAEAENYFGMSLVSPKEFKFSAGRYKNTLVKNCLALGLAQSFIEPLEATSIYVTCNVLNSFCHANALNTWDSKFTQDEVNEPYGILMNGVATFVHLHYITNRKDTAFWREFSSKYPLLEETETVITALKNHPKAELPFELGMVFAEQSWVKILSGLGRVEYGFPITKEAETYCAALEKNQNNVVRSCMGHQEFIEYLETS